MLLTERVTTIPFKIICWVLMVTMNSLTMSFAWAEANQARSQEEYDAQIEAANSFGNNLFNSIPSITETLTSDNEILVDGEVMFDEKSASGQQENDYIPANTDTYGDDAAIIISAENAKELYESKEAETGAELAYGIVKKSSQTMKPDLSNDPIWENSDLVFDNLKEIAKDFAECNVSTELITTGSVIHVPDYKRCERIPVITDTVTIGHSYDVGILKHESGPLNLEGCGTGCLDMWIGTVGDNYWSGNGTVYEEEMAFRVIQPKAIESLILTRAKFDDYFQVYLNEDKIYQGPSGYDFPENIPAYDYGSSDITLAVNGTYAISSLDENEVVNFKTRTSVVDRGEGYAKIRIKYDPTYLIYNEVWNDEEKVGQAQQIQKQIDDGFCTGSVTCTNMPALDENGCTTVNGIYVCEEDFLNGSPIDGISPFCKTVVATSDCGFNEGEICTVDMNGVETCFNNETVDKNTCIQYEQDETCSFVGSECLDGSTGDSGFCYTQEDTFDCGFDADNTKETAEEVLTCDGVLQCVGESCYSPKKDGDNESFSEVVAMLQVLTYAASDMTCTGFGETAYQEDDVSDNYTPTYVCEDGWEWDGDAELCIKNKMCSYDSNNYYVSSIRNGTEVMANGSIVVSDSSASYCRNQYDGSGKLYTCGTLQEKVGTDNYYAVCSSESQDASEFGCPSETHEIKNGVCVVKPIPTCETDFSLVEGDNIWSVEDDYCILNVSPNITCQSGYSWNGYQCQHTNSTDYDYTCPTGYTSTENQCKKANTTGFTNTCPSGYYSTGSGCKKSTNTGYNYTCPSGYASNGKTCTKDVEQCSSNVTQGGTKYDSDRNWTTVSTKSTQMSTTINFDGDRVSKTGSYTTLQNGIYTYTKEKRISSSKNNGRYIYGYGVCRTFESKINATASCPSGYSSNGSVCTKNTYTGYTQTCPSGYTSNGSVCVKYTYKDFDESCPSGYSDNGSVCIQNVYANPNYSCDGNESYNADTGYCEIIEDAELACPDEYPIWDENKQQCTKNWLGYAPKVDGEGDKEGESLAKKAIEVALTPLKFVLDIAVSPAYASEEEQAGVTQETMEKYISTKMQSAQDRVITNQELLGITTTAFSQASATDSSSSSIVTEHEGDYGTENVQCELFKGTAAECKIAVGGMQNCCESPVATSLSDYIALTQNTIALEGGIAQLGMIEGYSGVWNTASSYVADAATYAWDGVWGSAAETASGEVAQSATGEAVGAATQAIMSYANTFITETFGAEAAGMFFQTTASGAIAPSAGMAAVGAALMVVFYAYLAYVVFTLLVNIVFECTDEEFELANKVELLSTHYIGTYCKTKVISCIEKRESYCQFDSPLSRIIMEEIYKQPQMGLSWGTAKNPNCAGLTLSDIDKVDWSLVNVDEWTGILIATDNYIDSDYSSINIETLTGAGSYLDDMNGTTGTDQERDNVLEMNEERLENIDVESKQREDYESMWNDIQDAPN